MKKYVRETLILSDGKLYWTVDDLILEWKKKYPIVERYSDGALRVDSGKLPNGEDEAFVTYEVLKLPELPATDNPTTCKDCSHLTSGSYLPYCEIWEDCLKSCSLSCAKFVPKAGESSEESV